VVTVVTLVSTRKLWNNKGFYNFRFFLFIYRSKKNFSKNNLFCNQYLGAKSGLNERRLLDDLLENYNKLERPVINETEAVVLSFGLTLQQIIDVVSFIKLDFLRLSLKKTMYNIILMGY